MPSGEGCSDFVILFSLVMYYINIFSLKHFSILFQKGLLHEVAENKFTIAPICPYVYPNNRE